VNSIWRLSSGNHEVTETFQRLGPGMSMVVQLPPEHDLVVTDDLVGEPEPLVIT
jgi:hypothetical protein